MAAISWDRYHQYCTSEYSKAQATAQKSENLDHHKLGVDRCGFFRANTSTDYYKEMKPDIWDLYSSAVKCRIFLTTTIEINLSTIYSRTQHFHTHIVTSIQIDK